MSRVHRLHLALLAALTATLLVVQNAFAQTPPIDTSKYPTYAQTPGFESSQYYIQPIKGLVGGNRDIDVIAKDLLNQGYESYCASPDVTIDLGVDSQESVENFLDEYKNGVALNLTSTYTLDLEYGLIPLLRDTSKPQFLTSSMEEYFGFKDITQTEENYPTAELYTAPINTLLSQQQRCEQSIKIILAQRDMCNRLSNPDECALYKRGIPGTNSTIKNALDSYLKYKEPYSDVPKGTIQATCEALLTPDAPLNGLSQTKFDELKKSALNTPLYLDRSYRLAFLVAAIERIPEQPGQLFNFFSTNNSGKDPKHMVLTLAFKVPDVLTNKDYKNTSGAVMWSDASMLTRNALMPRAENLSEDPTDPGYQLQAIQERNNWIGKATSDPSGPINCTNDPTCQDELVKALVNIINAQKPGCSSKPPEYWKLIGEKSNVTPPADDDASRKYTTQFGDFILKNLFPDAISANSDKASIQISTNLDVNRTSVQKIGGPAKINFYLVYPTGFEYEKTIDALKGTFLSKSQQSAVAAKEDIKETFEIAEDRSGLTPGSATHTYLTGCVTKEDPITGLPYEDCDGEDSFTYSTSDLLKQPARVLGARLGFWLRTVQKSLTRYMSGPYSFLANCQTTEDFLTGTCSLFDLGNSPSAVGKDVASCDEIRNTVIDVPTLAEWKDMIEAAANEAGIDPVLLWGVFRIEGSPFLTSICTGAATAQCVVDRAGGNGPFQIINPICAQPGQASATNPSLQHRTKNYCELDVALYTAAHEMIVFKAAGGGTNEGAFGWYGGFGKYVVNGKCSDEAPPIPGCCLSHPGLQDIEACPEADRMNYCECANWYGEQMNDYQCP